MKQFCLLSYEDLTGIVPLFDEDVPGGNTNVTVIIGPNGSGKSRLLSAVVDELCLLDSIRSGDDGKYRKSRIAGSKATLRYRFDGRVCEIARTGYSVDCFVDEEWSDIKALPFPKLVAVVTHLPTDKFPFANRKDSDFYRYLGLRQATNLTTTKALETKVLQSLVYGFTQSKFGSRFDSWLTLAGFKSEIAISMELASKALLASGFDNFKHEMLNVDSRRNSARVRLDSIDAEKQVEKVWKLFNIIRDLNWTQERRPSCAYNLNFLLEEPENAKVWLEGFDLARRWRLFNSVDLIMTKPKGRFPFSSLSSGEQQLIGNSARLLAEVDSEALIVIDEPEVSLHPEWQIKYIPTLRSCLSAVSAVHVLIATHSHFMVSDLDNETSSLVTTSNDEGGGVALFDGAVYGRSPENILYRVFGVATSGNAFVENDLYRALKMISNREVVDLVELRSIYMRLNKVRGEDNAAMNVVLDQIHEFIEVRQ